MVELAMEGFDFEEEQIRKEILKSGVKRVLLQLPEGLKPEGPRLAKLVEKSGAIAIISADPCYGACDISVNEAENLGANLILHFGHAEFVGQDRVRTIYVESRSKVTVDRAVEHALPLLSNYIKIGLATTVQHLGTLNNARAILVSAGKTVTIGDSGRISYPGQVIGCNYSNVKSVAGKVDAFLFIGGGIFHALGIALATFKPTVVADPFDNRAFSVDDEAQKIVRQRWVCVEEAERAKTFGIIVGLKPGQKRLNEALRIKEVAENHDKSAVLLAAKEITPETLLEFPSIDAYVNTACPRISLDTSNKFSKPVLTSNEFTVAIGESSWEDLLKKGLFEN